MEQAGKFIYDKILNKKDLPEETVVQFADEIR
jgi:hypothetical protein